MIYLSMYEQGPHAASASRENSVHLHTDEALPKNDEINKNRTKGPAAYRQN